MTDIYQQAISSMLSTYILGAAIVGLMRLFSKCSFGTIIISLLGGILLVNVFLLCLLLWTIGSVRQMMQATSFNISLASVGSVESIDGGEEDTEGNVMHGVMRAVHQSLRSIMDPASGHQNTEQARRTPPTVAQLRKAAESWAHILAPFVVESSPTSSPQCVICMNATIDIPSALADQTADLHLDSTVKLDCGCLHFFHHKCILEWFHFNEKQSPTVSTIRQVTCPACRYVFERTTVAVASSSPEDNGVDSALLEEERPTEE